MHVHFADRLAADGTIRCTACSHEVIVRGGDVVPRCYCGGHEFLFQATRPDGPSHSSRSPDDASPADDAGARRGSAPS